MTAFLAGVGSDLVHPVAHPRADISKVSRAWFKEMSRDHKEINMII